MARRPYRIPMFFKFLAGCLSLAFLLIAGAGVVVHLRTRMESRGNYLEKHFKRYQDYQEGLGRAVSAVVDLVVHEPFLRQALTGPPDDPAAAKVPRIAADVFDILSGKNSIRPDLMILFDRTGKLLWSSPAPDAGDGRDARTGQSPGNVPGPLIDAQDLGAMDAVARVRAGSSYYDKVLIHDGRAYQIIGAPIHALRGQNGGPNSGEASPQNEPPSAAASPAFSQVLAHGDVVGGLIVGVDITRYMRQYMEQSDSRAHMQHRLVLIAGGQVVASVLPRELWPELAEKLDRDNWTYIAEGNFKQRVAPLSTGKHDFYDGPVEGFAGLDHGQVGDLFLLRSRANLVGRGPKLPWFAIGIAVVLSLFIASLLALWITRPIKAFVRQSQDILAGETDLTQRIALNCRDETQDLADNINRVFARLYELAMEVQGAAFQVGASSAEISAASKQMASGLKDQTLKIEGSTAAVTELSASIQQVAANAADATGMAEKSNISVTSAVARMEQIRAAVEEAADKMQDLGESSKRIGNIVEVIRQISEQTSLLALNASIEAAHAGEHGRGFAVVADEVSSLARRVGQSAKDIEALIQTIKEQTAEAVHSMQVGTREVEGGTALVTTTLTDLKSLIEVVKDTAGAVQEQALVSDEIARSMDAVQTIAAEMLAGSEESVIQAEQLHELAFALEQSVGGFNLDGKGAAMALHGHGDDDRGPARLPEHAGAAGTAGTGSFGSARSHAGAWPGRTSRSQGGPAHRASDHGPRGRRR